MSILFFFFYLVGTISGTRHLYVSRSTSTCDEHSGESLDKPLCSLVQAQAKVRELKSSSNETIEIHVQRGMYRLDEPLVFQPEDGGSSAMTPVIYRAYCPPTQVQVAAAGFQTDYPYVSQSQDPLRSLWNGIDEKDEWVFPPVTTLPIASESEPEAAESEPEAAEFKAEEFCLDRNDVGRVCYTDKKIATCYRGCSTSCLENVHRKTYSEEQYQHFYHLFGKNLRKEEDCIEICSSYCSGCDEVIITSLQLVEGNWQVHDSGRNIWVLDLSSTGLKEMSALYVNGIRATLARYPNQMEPMAYAFPSSSSSTTSEHPHVLSIEFNRDDFSTRVDQWTSLSHAQVVLYPEGLDAAKLMYSMMSIDTSTMYFETGGGQINADIFLHGPEIQAKKSVFYIQNVREELDAVNEWYFDVTTQRLYFKPSAADEISTFVFETPILSQLVRIIGTNDTSHVSPATGVERMYENDALGPPVAHLQFDGLTFTGTRPTKVSDTYERPSGAQHTITRAAVIYLDGVSDIQIHRCTVAQSGGNAILVYGHAQDLVLTNNHVYDVGESGILVISKRKYDINQFREPVLSHLVFSSQAVLAHNRISRVGQVLPQAAAIQLVCNRLTRLVKNLIDQVPVAGHNMIVLDADGGLATASKELMIRPIRPMVIPTTAEAELKTRYTITIPIQGADTKLWAKIVGSPDCPPGNGRNGALHGTYQGQCSDCCAYTAASAKIRQSMSEGSWDDAGYAVAIGPGDDTVELAVDSSMYFNTEVEVYIRFHRILANGIIDLYGGSWHAKWKVHTRHCVVTSSYYPVECGGPCGCGKNAAEMASQGPTCEPGDVIDSTATICTGPYVTWSDCDTDTFHSIRYYNCVSSCFTQSCT